MYIFTGVFSILSRFSSSFVAVVSLMPSSSVVCNTSGSGFGSFFGVYVKFGSLIQAESWGASLSSKVSLLGLFL